MNRDEALSLLELGDNPSPDDVKDAFRRMIAIDHPDRGGGPDRVSTLVEARDVLETTQNALVPIDQIQEIVLAATGAVERNMQRAEQREETQKVIRGVVRVGTTAVRRQQRLTGLMSFTSAVLGAASQIGRLLPAHDGSALLNAIGVLLGAVAVLFGLMVAFLNQRKAQIQVDVEEVADALDDKSLLVATLREIVGDRRLRDGFTSEEWTAGVDRWSHGDHLRIGEYRRQPSLADVIPPARRTRSLVDIARRMGSVEVGRLVMSKAKEHSVLRELEGWESDRLVVTYTLNRPPSTA